jgi:hypothetical protein
MYNTGGAIHFGEREWQGVKVRKLNNYIIDGEAISHKKV